MCAKSCIGLRQVGAISLRSYHWSREKKTDPTNRTKSGKFFFAVSDETARATDAGEGRANDIEIDKWYRDRQMISRSTNDIEIDKWYRDRQMISRSTNDIEIDKVFLVYLLTRLLTLCIISQGDQMSLWKKRPNSSPTHCWSQLTHN
jgi:hypothetical protein